MDQICKVAHCNAVNMNFIETNGDESGCMDGYLVQIFIPLDKRADVDRNDDKRREMTEIIDAAITAVEG